MLADPGPSTVLAEWLAEELPAVLRETVFDGGWDIAAQCTGDEQVPITDIAREHRRARDWDVLLVRTDLLRRTGTRPLTSAFSEAVGAGSVSVPAMGWSASEAGP